MVTVNLTVTNGTYIGSKTWFIETNPKYKCQVNLMAG